MTAPIVLSAKMIAKRHGSLEVPARRLDGRQNKVKSPFVLGPSGGGKSTFLRCLNGPRNF